MRKIPISGGPHSGKTTLLEALQTEFPEAYFVPEPAESVITRELAKQALRPDYEPIVPWINYRTFGPMVANESEILEAAIPSDAMLVFQDRSLIDTIGYARLNNFDTFVSKVQQRAKLANYSLALFCEPVGEYTVTDVRRETAEEARKTHRYLEAAYNEASLQVVHLPAVSVEERIDLIYEAIEDV